MKRVVNIFAKITREFSPRGTHRFLSLLYNPKFRRIWFAAFCSIVLLGLTSYFLKNIFWEKIILAVIGIEVCITYLIFSITEEIQTIFAYEPDLMIHINTASALEWSLFFLGYESGIRNIIKTKFQDNGTFVDVGANVGIHTLVAAKRAKEVIAIEPMPENADRLDENCRLNNLNNVTILRCLASDREGHRMIYKGIAGQPGSSSLYPDEDMKEGLICKSVTLDSLFKDKKVDFIKIDAEGEDGRILLGAKATITRDKPIIVFEYSHKWKEAGVSLEEIKGLLVGYEINILNGNEICAEIFCLPKDV